MTLWDALHLASAEHGPDAGPWGPVAPVSLWALATPAASVVTDLPCPQVDALFRGEHDARTSLVVEDPATGATGLLVRWRFERLMSGRYGFGRALHQRTPVGRVTDWTPALLTRDADLEEGVAAMLGRDGDRRHDDLLMRGEGQWRRLSAGTLLEVLAAQMARRAGLDELTGLANRMALLEHLHRVCAPGAPGAAGAASGGGGPAGLVFLDLDGLKVVNDVMGHVAGDALLVSTARRLSAETAPGDVLARLGGDEFVLALGPGPGAGGSAAERVEAAAHRMLAALRRPDAALDPRVRSSASVGAVVATPGMRPEDLLREADQAMYRAKRAGGDRVEVVGGQRTAPRPALTGLSFGRALEEDQLVLHHQPIVEAVTGRVRSTEALVRWMHPQHGLLGADVVLAAASAERSMLALDLWVMRAAARQVLRWDAALTAPPPLVNVNISPTGLEDPDLAAHVLRVLDEEGCPPGRIRLELPETATAALARSAAHQLDALRAAGMALTLDDVGTGSSSLSHLASLAVQGMKIDGSFVARLVTDHRAEAVVRMLVRLGGELGLAVTAEGVETAEQWERLRAIGVGFVQGYGVARPAPAAVLGPWLDARAAELEDGPADTAELDGRELDRQGLDRRGLDGQGPDGRAGRATASGCATGG